MQHRLVRLLVRDAPPSVPSAPSSRLAARRSLSITPRSAAWSASSARLSSAPSPARLARRPIVSARSAFRITATSIPSWTSAPATGGSHPSAATTIARPDSAIPATTL
jgi:hypothetical protein